MMAKKTLQYLFSVVVLLLAAHSFAADTADFVGDKKCRRCHKDNVADLASNIHSKAHYWDAETSGCESCHGPGSIHAKSELPSDILNPARLGSEEASAQCLTCHEDGRRHWQASPHDAMDVSCLSCHSVHNNDNPDMLNTPSIAETCYECHSEQRAYTLKRSAHPLRDASRVDNKGKMTCSSCHNPHGTQAEDLISANTVNDKCYECHQEMKAPVLWEHSAVKESCLNCHNPHGSNHEMMLVAKQPRLCQQCHQQGRHQTIAGEESGFFVGNRSCSNCHAQIHGSNHPGGVKIKR
jgi:DmsE family decaheme c-type cytochrome